MKLAIFRGGFNRKAAKTVADTSNRLLQSLKHKSIIHEVSKRRFDLHPLVQQFAFEKLEESGRLSETQEQHLTFFEAYVTDSLRALEHGDYLYPLRDVELEKENVHMALDWGLAQEGDVRMTAVKLTASMADYWYSRTHFGVGAHYCALALSTLPESLLWARIVRRYTYFLREQGENEQAAEISYRLFLYSQNQADVKIKLLAYSIFTRQLAESGKYDETIDVAEQYFELSQAVVNPYHMNVALFRLADAYKRKGNLEKQLEIEQMIVDLLRQQEDDILLASATYNLGLSLFYSNIDMQKARLLFEESLALKRLIGERGGIVRRLSMLSEIALLEGREEEAEAYHKEAESIVDSLDAPMRKLEYYQLLIMFFEVRADWPPAIQGTKEGLQLALHLNEERYILFLSLALTRFYIHADLLNQAKIYLERGTRLFFETDFPYYYTDGLLTFSFYWLAVNQPFHGAECYVYFLRRYDDNPTYSPIVARLSQALAPHFSTVELEALEAELPEKDPKELIRHYLEKLSA